MAKTITQKVVFKNTTTKELYELYMDAKKHAIVTGSKTKIKHKVGAKFSAYGGDIKGRNLELVENELIVQSWRESSWSKATLDSILIITFEQVDRDAELTMVHANVPEKHGDNIALGWEDYYWKGWRKFIVAKKELKLAEKFAKNSDKDEVVKKESVKPAAKKAVKKPVKKAVKKAVKKVAKKAAKR